MYFPIFLCIITQSLLCKSVQIPQSLITTLSRSPSTKILLHGNFTTSTSITAYSQSYSRCNTTLSSAVSNGSSTSVIGETWNRSTSKPCDYGLCSRSSFSAAVASAVTKHHQLSDLELLENCVLWNSSCSANRTDARERFFHDFASRLMETPCFNPQIYLLDAALHLGADPVNWDARQIEWEESTAECSKLESPYRTSQYAQIKDWMRSPQYRDEGAEPGWSSRKDKVPDAEQYHQNVKGLLE